MVKNSERRTYYRINDEVGLTYKILSQDEDIQSSLSGNLGLSVTSLLAEIDHEFNQATNTLWHENPTIAKALGLLNKKLSIIAANSLSEEGQDIDDYEEMMVNISGCGLSFNCTENLSTGTRLLLTIVLKPANTPLNFTGEVIASANNANNAEKPYSVRVNFDENNNAQEQLIQHIVQKQCAQISKNIPTLMSEDQ
ncbi:MAG: PilZ domain-containing protein [Porticoccus sp.]